jgi:parallel beta-helix repeat protein
VRRALVLCLLFGCKEAARAPAAPPIEERIAPLQVVERAKKLHLGPDAFAAPEARARKLADAAEVLLANLDGKRAAERFTGKTAAELNRFLAAHAGGAVEIAVPELRVAESIRVPPKTRLDGAQARLVAEGKLRRVFDLADADAIVIASLRIAGSFRYGIYARNAHGLVIRDVAIDGALDRPLVVIGKGSDLFLVDNRIGGGRGGIFVQGDFSGGLIAGNRVRASEGTSNWDAGLVLTALPIVDAEDPEKAFPDGHWPRPTRLADELAAPHELVVRGNVIEDGRSSGLYCDGCYLSAIVENTLAGNDKEGLCLDYGAIGNFVADNRVLRNGRRIRQSDRDLELDGVAGFGKMGDGSAAAKVPGVSLDNASDNTLEHNLVEDNHGGGIKLVRVGLRNRIAQNTLVENNLGENPKCHFFAVELGSAGGPPEAKELDFAPSFLNTVQGNLIDGAHWAGVFLGEGSAQNRIAENVITRPEHFAIESISKEPNDAIDNYTQAAMSGVQPSFR